MKRRASKVQTKANTYSIYYFTSRIVGIGLKVARNQTSLVYNVALFLLGEAKKRRRARKKGHERHQIDSMPPFRLPNRSMGSKAGTEDILCIVNIR